MRTFQYLFLLSILSFCSSPAKNNETTQESEVAEEELTYEQLYDLVIQQTAEMMEYHGEELDKSSAEFLTITEDGVCGENDCGKSLFLENSSENRIDLVLHAPFQIDGETSYVAGRYIIEPKQRIPIGCSHLCYDGEAILFERRIVGAKVAAASSEE